MQAVYLGLKYACMGLSVSNIHKRAVSEKMWLHVGFMLGV